MKKYILKLASQPSTWRGAVLIFTALGVHIAPSVETELVSVGLALAGLLGATLVD